MNAARPLPLPARRFAILCPGFTADRVRRQPWHVADGLARGLVALGHEALVVSDAGPPPGQVPYRTLTVPALLAGGAAAPALLAALAGQQLERVYLVTGAARLARLRELRLEAPVSLVMASPRLTLRELARVGVLGWWREREVLTLPLVNSLLPALALRAGWHRSAADEVVYLSPAARARFAAAGLPAGRLLLPQVDASTLIAERPPAAGFTVCYFGPPLATRGADLALEAFEAAVTRGLDGRLLMLLRPDSGPAAMARLVARIERSPCRDRVEHRTEMLGPAALRRELARARAFLLPFRVPVSEVPLVVIESCLSGRPTIVLEAPGVGEIARALGGIVAASPTGLTDALLAAAAAPAVAAPGAAAWTDWPGAVAPLLDRPKSPLARYRMVALSGADGSGKTFLLGRLQRRLDAAGVAHRHVWSRFRNYLSEPLLGLARLTGHNRKEVHDSVRIGYHDFAGTPWLAWPFLLLQLADGAIDAWWRYRRPADRRLVLADRCLYDTLVDLAVDTRLERVIFGPAGRWLVRRLPTPRLAVAVERPVAAIRADRPDALLDRNFARRRSLYRRLAREFSLPVVDNAGTPDAFLDLLERLADPAVAGKGAPP